MNHPAGTQACAATGSQLARRSLTEVREAASVPGIGTLCFVRHRGTLPVLVVLPPGTDQVSLQPDASEVDQ